MDRFRSKYFLSTFLSIFVVGFLKDIYTFLSPIKLTFTIFRMISRMLCSQIIGLNNRNLLIDFQNFPGLGYIGYHFFFLFKYGNGPPTKSLNSYRREFCFSWLYFASHTNVKMWPGSSILIVLLRTEISHSWKTCRDRIRAELFRCINEWQTRCKYYVIRTLHAFTISTSSNKCPP